MTTKHDDRERLKRLIAEKHSERWGVAIGRDLIRLSRAAAVDGEQLRSFLRDFGEALRDCQDDDELYRLLVLVQLWVDELAGADLIVPPS